MALDDSTVAAASGVFDDGSCGFLAAFPFGRPARAVFVTFFRTVLLVTFPFVRFLAIDVS